MKRRRPQPAAGKRVAAKRKGQPRTRTSRRRKAPSGPAGGAGAQSEQRVRIRMYRPGLGECFLLTFPRLGVPFHMLIDCGVVAGRKNGLRTMKAIAEDIRKTTGGRLDVVVITHRHWDHISGFFQAREVFEKMSVEQVWLGWGEDPTDADARKLEHRRRSGIFGSAGRGVRSRPDEAIAIVRRLGRVVWYWRGGQGPVALSGVAGARVFFLGPPTLHANLGEAFRAAASRPRAAESPFDERDRVSIDEARTDPRFALYFVHEATGGADPSDDGPGWRQIGQPSRNPIPRLRLDRPDAVNDSSLVMAIELIGPRGGSKVLLFPGDAQVASWLSWHEHRWPPDAPDAMTCATLLQRTVLYKVSHKGTEPGTPMQFGLEMMTSPDLVAMISVDEAAARERRWIMPAPTVLSALTRSARGRVIRSDSGAPRTPATDSDLTDAEWEQFRRSVNVTDLYIDYQLDIPRRSAVERAKSESNWAAANERRVYLVDKKLAGTIRPEEDAELREIERLLEEYMSVTAPTGPGLLTELRESVERAKRSGGET
jgi:hypothetical protein